MGIARDGTRPFAVFYGKTSHEQTTIVLAAKVDSCEAIRRADAYNDLKFGSGDGVVLAKAAMLPEGYKAVVITACHLTGSNWRSTDTAILSIVALPIYVPFFRVGTPTHVRSL